MKVWTTARLGEVCDVRRGTTITQKEAMPGSVPVVGGGVVPTYFHNQPNRPAGTITVSASGANAGFVNRYDTPIFASDCSTIITRNELQLSQDFVFRFLQFQQEAINLKLRRGAAQPHVYASDLADLVIPICNIEEQRRIVAGLDEAFAAIATASANSQRNLVNAVELFASELDALICEAQKNYSNRTLVDHCERVTVGHVGPMKDRYQEGGIPFLRSQNVRPFAISLEGMMFIDEGFDAELQKSRLRPGDVAVVRTGYPGTAAVIPATIPIANCADLVIIRPGKALNPHFLAAFLNSNIGKRAVAGELVGAAQKHFNVGSAKKVLIPLPSLSEQHALVDRATKFAVGAEQLAEVGRARLRHLASFKVALLRRAFAGDPTSIKARDFETIAA